jgi:lysophospholipase L1-like esterase
LVVSDERHRGAAGAPITWSRAARVLTTRQYGRVREVVLAGDSHLTPSSKWGTRKLGPRLRDQGYSVVELAKGGLTSQQALVLYDGPWPSPVVVLSLGANDAAPWKQVPLTDFVANVGRLAGRAERPIILTPAPVCECRQAGRANAVLRRYADAAEDVASRVGASVVPVFDHLLRLMEGDVDLHVADGVHLNDRAYDELELLVSPLLAV